MNTDHPHKLIPSPVLKPLNPPVEHGYAGTLGEVVDAMLILEQAYHDEGWDSVPALLGWVWRDGTLQMAAGPLGIEHHPRDDLAELAHAHECPDRNRPALVDMYPRRPLAHVLLFEGWEHTDKGVEVRHGYLARGRQYVMLRRARGEDGVSLVDRNEKSMMVGRVTADLLRIHRAAQRLELPAW